MPRLINMRPDSEVEPLLSAHLNHLRKLNQSARSLRERRLTVLRLARWLKHPVALATRDELTAYQDAQAHLTPASMHNMVVHLSQYLGWLVEGELRADDPSRALVRPRNVHQSLPRPMADALIERALAEAAQPIHAWIGLGAFCGLRCMEIAPLQRENIVTGGAPHLRVVGKGNKERVVPLPAALLDELLADFPARGYLFERMDGRAGPPSAVRVSERINDHLHRLGIPVTAHSLRHRFGTKLYEATGDPFLVAEVMGHASVDTTKMYVKVLSSRAAGPIEAISHLAA